MPSRKNDSWLLDAGTYWAWVVVMKPAYGLGNIVEGRGFLLVSLGVVMKPEVEPVVVTLRAGAARSLGEGGRANRAEEDDAAKDEQ